METMTYTPAKAIKGQEYIYLCMAYMLCKANKGNIKVGDDNGMTGEQQYYRHFTIMDYKGQIILTEKKVNKCFADLSRNFVVIEGNRRLTIKEYINASGENGSRCWTH